MCGIAGIIDFRGLRNEEPILRRMLGLLRHRGPDSFGIYRTRCASLASARLRIIDLSTGDQPIHNEDRSIWIVQNGEVFNYLELRRNLERKGHRFYTQSDTEVLVHLYEEKGTDLFSDLNGQFGFAIWDRNKQQLLLGRDRMGIRPLFYWTEKSRLVFGSEIKAIFLDEQIPREINPQTLSDIFTCWAPLGAETPFKDIAQVPPGDYALFSREGLVVRRYWEISFEKTESRNKGLEEWAGELQDLLLDAARIRLRADVPVGTYLSGGLDSSYISTLIKNNFNNELCTFSVSFSDGRFDETLFQEKAVKVLGTKHKMAYCTERDIGDVFEKVIWHCEVPILRTAPAPFFMLSRLVRDNHFKVVLTGEGADEIFAGYNIFKEDRIRRFWARQPESQSRPGLLRKLYPYVFKDENGKAEKYRQGFFKKGLQEVGSPAYSHLLRWTNTAQLANFFSNEFRNSTGTMGSFLERFCAMLPDGFMTWDPLSRAQYAEFSIFLSNYLLSSQGDRMAMANAVEGRFPYLDHRVVEFASGLPIRYRLNGLKEKFILKKVAEKVVSLELVNRAKTPYRAPISSCFVGKEPRGYVLDFLSEDSVKRSGYFDPKKVKGLVAKCHRGSGSLMSERENMALAGILSTQLVDQQFIRNFPPFPIQEPENIRIFSN
jgi:asparagine synthase (glutamine-hydrolysing)